MAWNEWEAVKVTVLLSDLRQANRSNRSVSVGGCQPCSQYECEFTACKGTTNLVRPNRLHGPDDIGLASSSMVRPITADRRELGNIAFVFLRGARWSLRLPVDGCIDESGEERMCGRWFRFEFGVELNRHEPRVIANFNDFYK